MGGFVMDVPPCLITHLIWIPRECVCVCKPVLSAATVTAGHSHTKRQTKKKRHIAATHPHKHTRIVQFVSAGHLAHVRAHRMLCSSRDGWLVKTWYTCPTKNFNLQLKQECDATQLKLFHVYEAKESSFLLSVWMLIIKYANHLSTIVLI